MTTLLAVDGWPVELADTAGWRAAAGPLEAEGMARGRAAMAAADLTLWLIDGSVPPVWPDANLGPVRLVVTKADLPPTSAAAEALLRVSGVTGAGLPELLEALARWLVPEPPPPGAAVPFTPALADAVTEARRQLHAGGGFEALAHLGEPGGDRG